MNAIETLVAVIEARGRRNLTPFPGCGFIWKDDPMAAGINFSNFGVDRIVTYHRPEAARVPAAWIRHFAPGGS